MQYRNSLWTAMNNYTRHLSKPSDIQEHLGLLRGLAMKCGTVVELGFRTGVSTSAFLAGGAKVFSYDISNTYKPYVLSLAKEYPKTFTFKVGDSRKVDIPECDMLFIDTDHTEATTLKELGRHRDKVSKWIVLHDTVSFGKKDRPPGRGAGVMSAIDTFLDANLDWCILLHLNHNNGLTILER